MYDIILCPRFKISPTPVTLRRIDSFSQPGGGISGTCSGAQVSRWRGGGGEGKRGGRSRRRPLWAPGWRGGGPGSPGPPGDPARFFFFVPPPRCDCRPVPCLPWASCREELSRGRSGPPLSLSLPRALSSNQGLRRGAPLPPISVRFDTSSSSPTLAWGEARGVRGRPEEALPRGARRARAAGPWGLRSASRPAPSTGPGPPRGDEVQRSQRSQGGETRSAPPPA